MYYNDYYNYGSNYDDYGVGAAVGGLALGILIFIWVIALAIAVVQIIGMWKVFKKAGKNGWEAIIPFYNVWVLFEISGYPGYYMFFGLIPCVGPIVLLIFEILAYISLSKKFNKSSGFAVLMIFLPVIAFCILGFGKDTYDESLGEHKNTQPNTPAPAASTAEAGKFCGNCGTKVAKNAKHCSNCGKEL